jgi:hypothetical protein
MAMEEVKGGDEGEAAETSLSVERDGSIPKIMISLGRQTPINKVNSQIGIYLADGRIRNRSKLSGLG